jgi:predicted nucleic acid-binding protein
MIILDTNILSELMRPRPDTRVLEWTDAFDMVDIGTTAVSVAEILYGIGSLSAGRKKRGLLEAATTVFDEYFSGRIFAFDHLAAVEYADIVCQRDSFGTPISMADAQIAAICRRFSAGFATRNTKDFDNIGLVLINPWEA